MLSRNKSGHPPTILSLTEGRNNVHLVSDHVDHAVITLPGGGGDGDGANVRVPLDRFQHSSHTFGPAVVVI